MLAWTGFKLDIAVQCRHIAWLRLAGRPWRVVTGIELWSDACTGASSQGVLPRHLRLEVPNPRGIDPRNHGDHHNPFCSCIQLQWLNYCGLKARQKPALAVHTSTRSKTDTGNRSQPISDFVVKASISKFPDFNIEGLFGGFYLDINVHELWYQSSWTPISTSELRYRRKKRWYRIQCRWLDPILGSLFNEIYFFPWYRACVLYNTFTYEYRHT